MEAQSSMTSWLAVIGSTVTALGLVLGWWLSDEQKQKRKNKDVVKKMDAMRKDMANLDGDAISNKLKNLRL